MVISRFARVLSCAGVCTLLFVASATAEVPTTIIPEGTKWEELSREGKVFGEGVVAAKDGQIYLSDITTTAKPEDNPGGTIFRFDPTTGVVTKHMEPSGMAAGLHVDKSGAMWIAQTANPKGARRVVRQDLATGAITEVAAIYQGKRLNNPNDVTSDSRGRIYFTDAVYFVRDAMELPNAVYRVDLDGKLTQISTDILRPNGIEVSPDGRHLYIAAANAPMLVSNPHGPAQDRFGIPNGGVVMYDLDRNGAVSDGRVIYRNDSLVVDGMALDTEGNLYLAQHDGNRQSPKSELTVIDRVGKVLGTIPLASGMGLTTNVAFGRGTDANSLYVSTGAPWGLFRIKTAKRGHYSSPLP
jgi:gluconolactonase